MRNIEEIIARNILVRMTDLGMGRTELAENSKLSRQTISRILNCRQKTIRASNLDAIAKALKTTKSELEHDPITMSQLAGLKVDESDSTLDNRALRDRIRKLESLIEGIPEHYLEALKNSDKARLDMFESLFGPEEDQVKKSSSEN